MSSAPIEPALAVIIHKSGSATERFVERHIRESFGGNTVVVARQRGGVPGWTQPTLVMDARDAPAASGFAATWENLAGLMRYAYWGVPAGAQLQRIRDFWQAHGVGAVLAEFGPLGCWMAPVARACGLPMFVYFRGYDASRKLESWSSVLAYRRMFANIDGVFAVSQFLIDNLRRAGLTAPNAHVIPSGTNPALFRPGVKDPGLLVSVGRFVAKKCPQATVRAFAKVASGAPHLRLEMVGTGPLLEECIALAAALGVQERVVFARDRDHRDIAELLSRATIYLQHSVTTDAGDTEGLPSSIQEAMAAGAVVVSTRHAGIPEVITEGETGFLVDEHDEAGYARALTRALADPQRLARMAIQARLLAERRLDTVVLQMRMESVILAAIRDRALRNTEARV